MSHTAKHPKRDPSHHRRHHRHTAAKQTAAGAAFGATAAAGAIPLGDRILGEGKTVEMAERLIGTLPKTMLTGLAIGFAVGGISGWAARSGEGYAERIEQERENAVDRQR